MNVFYVYILASKSRRIYVGVTNNIVHRVAQHRARKVVFTARYRMTRLVYCETTSDPMAAISREKQIKGWSRSKKISLIESMNPAWDDLAAGWTESVTNER